MSINNTFTTIKKFLTPNLSCDNIFICLGDVAQLARASGSYPCAQLTIKPIMAGYINWLDSSVHTRNVGGSSPSPATNFEFN